ncbi:uncharacterized protein VNE69_04081 [Vairimorpha necatrix]|uniref:Uncharacterized protein n=1 Tax=Vairimorpha necatrix TaxID=6039 RepID=A0AAX4JBM4_9MICR
MKMLKIFLTILFLHGFQKIYDNLNVIIMNKIQNNDFFTIDQRGVMAFNLRFDFDKCELNLDLEIIFHNFFTEENLIRTLKINCNKKSTTAIVEELEKKCKEKYEKKYMQSLIIIYNQKQARKHPIYSRIINHLKYFKTLRKEFKVKHDIVYEHIIDENELLARIVSTLKMEIHCIIPNLCIACTKHNKTRSIIFSISSHDMYHIFEIDIKEIIIEKFPLNHEITTIHDNDFDIKISNYYCELYKNVYIDDLQNYTQPKMEVCSFTESLLDNKFKIEINKDKVKFTQDYDSNKYFLETNSVNLNDGIIISKKCLSEFKYFFKKLSSTMKNKYENNLCVEMFYRLIKTEDKVKFLLERLLNKTDTALSMIFAHLLLNMQIINKAEFKKIIESDELGDTRKTELINIVIEKTYQKNLSAEYLIKFCLLLEAEKFINENKFKCDSIFGTLKIIGSQMNKKKILRGLKITMNSKKLYRENNIDLTKIMSGIAVYGLNRIEKYKRIVSGELIKIISLFTENIANRCNNLGDITYFMKYDIITILGLNSDKVTNNNEIIYTALSEKLHLDAQKYFFKCLEPTIKNFRQKMCTSTFDKSDIQDFKYGIKNILETFRKMTFILALKKIKKDAKCIKIRNTLYSENISYEFNDEIQEITFFFINYLITEEITQRMYLEDFGFLQNNKKDDIKNFFKELHDKLHEDLETSIKRKYSKNFLMLFECELKNQSSIKLFCQQTLHIFHLIMNENDLNIILPKVLNAKLHDDFINSLQCQEQV